MKSITLTQPRPALITLGALKTITAPHGTTYRGQVAIHSAFWIPSFAQRLIEGEPVWSILKRARIDYLALPRSFVVAVADLVDCEQLVSAHVMFNQLEARVNELTDPALYVWRFGNVRPLVPPIRANGRPGLWNWRPPDWWEDRLQPPVEASAP